MPELSPADIEFIKDLREAREDERISRRDLMTLLGGGVVGAAAGGGGLAATGLASADASTSDSDGNVGLPGDPVDVFADGVDAAVVDTEQLSLTDPTLIYTWGDSGNGELLSTTDPSNHTDIFDALNTVMGNVPDGEQVEIWLPWSGSAGVSASTTFTIPTGKEIPNIKGYGIDAGSVVNYTATDGSAAIDVASSETADGGFVWEHFALLGPGQGTGSGEGIKFQNTVAQTAELTHLKVHDFGGAGISVPSGKTFITGSINHCTIFNCDVGVDIEMNGGSIHNCILEDNVTAQLRLEDSLKATVHDCVIDAQNETAPGIIVRSDDKRGGPTIRDNFLEGNSAHVTFAGTLNARKTEILDNFMVGGTDGVVVSTANEVTIRGNNFDNLSGTDVTLDGGSGHRLGENTHSGSATKFADNTGGSYEVVDPKTVYSETVSAGSGASFNRGTGVSSFVELDVTATPANDPGNDHGYSVDIFWDDSASEMAVAVSETQSGGGGDVSLRAVQTFPYPW